MSVTVSSKYRVVIPKHIRERMKLKPGQKVEFFELNGVVYFMPEVSVSSLAGTLKGAPPFDRDKEWADEERERFLGPE